MKRILLGVAIGIASSTLIAQRGSPTVLDAVSGDPKHYSVEFENELVRVVRARYGPGEKSVMHSHPASCAIFLGDQSFKFTIPDGTTEDDMAWRARSGAETRTSIFLRTPDARPPKSSSWNSRIARRSRNDAANVTGGIATEASRTARSRRALEAPSAHRETARRAGRAAARR